MVEIEEPDGSVLSINPQRVLLVEATAPARDTPASRRVQPGSLGRDERAPIWAPPHPKPKCPSNLGDRPQKIAPSSARPAIPATVARRSGRRRSPYSRWRGPPTAAPAPKARSDRSDLIPQMRNAIVFVRFDAMALECYQPAEQLVVEGTRRPRSATPLCVPSTSGADARFQRARAHAAGALDAPAALEYGAEGHAAHRARPAARC